MATRYPIGSYLKQMGALLDIATERVFPRVRMHIADFEETRSKRLLTALLTLSASGPKLPLAIQIGCCDCNPHSRHSPEPQKLDSGGFQHCRHLTQFSRVACSNARM